MNHDGPAPTRLRTRTSLPPVASRSVGCVYFSADRHKFTIFYEFLDLWVCDTNDYDPIVGE